MKRVLLISGGIDSSIMLIEQLYDKEENVDLELLYVKCGEVYEDAELKHLEKFVKTYVGWPLTTINISNAKVGKYDRFVPNRNMTIASIAVTSLGADEIWIGGLKDDNVIDKNDQAYKTMSYVLSLFSDKQVVVKSPYSDLTKGELVDKFLHRGDISKELATEILLSTFSCYDGKEEPCGNCPACFRKFVALESNGISSNIPLQEPIIKHYLKSLHNYSPDRINRTLIALRKLYGGIDCFDLDGTIAKINHSLPYDRKEVIYGMRDTINVSSKLRVIYTSRMESDRGVTEEWLKFNNVYYDVLLMNKPNYDSLYDDRAKVI